jgi:predicted ATP-dependent protease
LRLCCDPAGLPFETTSELDPLDEIIGQERAVEAIQFGMAIDRRGFNVFVHGPSGHGKLTAVHHYLGATASARPAPPAWCYRYNFDEPHRPLGLRLAPGRGGQLRADMDRLVDDLLVALPGALEAEVHQARRQRVGDEYQQRAQAGIGAVGEAAACQGLAVVHGDDGLSIAPVADGQPMPQDAFRALPEARQTELRAAMDALDDQLEAAIRAAHGFERAARHAVADLDRELARSEVTSRLADLRQRYADEGDVLAFFDAVIADVPDQLDLFRRPEQRPSADDDEASPPPSDDLSPSLRRRSDDRLRRYAVNVVVDPVPDGGAPVVVETHPTLGNLVGRVDQEQRFGAVVTDFTLVKAGALHRANGGFLVLEAEEVLKQPYSWDALKRALRNDVVRVEAPGGDGGAMSTVSLDPAPIPLSAKVILVGDTGTYLGLHEYDAEFPELFKVPAEFAASIPRSPANRVLYARFVATVAQRESLLPLDRAAVACVIDHGARLSGDAQRLSTDFLDVSDLVRESDFCARRRGATLVERADVASALAARERRCDLLRDVLHDDIARDVLLLSTSGSSVGQVNALTVVGRGDFDFGLPSRVTARVRLGGGEVVDIEREVDLGGPLHSKGVLILSGFLAGRYVPDESLAMSASLTFEQSYHEVEGDSASSAELYALLSALAALPVAQSLAVTGSVNQVGEIQAIGGANEKIEGFFDVCALDGLTGEQGVLIPAANVQHLMLRADVVEAVAAGKFRIIPVRTVDEGIAVLTGVPAGERGDDGQFPADSVNRRVEDRLRDLAAKRREHGRDGDDGRDGAAAPGRIRPRRSKAPANPESTPSPVGPGPDPATTESTLPTTPGDVPPAES